MKNNKTLQRVMSFMMILGILSSCGRYNYLSSKVSNATAQYQKDDVNELSEYVVVHHGSDVFRLMDAKIENGHLTGTRGEVNDFQENVYASALNGSAADLLIEEAKSFLDKIQEQTHVYLDKSYEIDSENIAIGLNDIDESKSLFKTKDGVAVFLSVLKVIGIVILAVIAGFVILFLIACNCPHVYTFDGESYHFTNTLFTGATAPNLERNDYKILTDYRPESSIYEMYIKNEENERHYTNVLELLVVNHTKNIQVVPGQDGEVHVVSDMKSPTSITNEKGGDLSPLAAYHDEQGYLFDSESDENMVNTYLTFDKPTDVANAKVILNLKNTEWAGVVYKTFASMMGDRYEGWVENNHKRSTEEAIAGMKKAGVPLVLSIKKNRKWVDVESINLVGEANYTSIAVPIDEELIAGTDIEIRLQAGFKFWDLDYVGMDFTPNEELKVNIIKPSLANGEISYLASLENDDDVYMEHLNTGDSTHLIFEGLMADTEKRTIIMHSKGYYLSQDKYAGKTYWRDLMKLKAPGGLSLLSKTMYSVYLNEYTLQTNE